MLVPVFAMYYKHRRIISGFNSNLATIQARRRDEAIRVLQLAEQSPDKLTRAERAAVEGKIAWRKSVASWQVARRDGSIDSSTWSTRGYGEIPSPKRETTSATSSEFRRDLEMAVQKIPPLAPFRDNERAINATAFTPAQTRETSLRDLENPNRTRNEKPEMIPLQNLASKHGLATVGASKDIEINLGTKANPATHLSSTIAPHRPSILTDGISARPDPAAEDATSYFPETKTLTPTMSYGFHLPRPQAGQAYVMGGKPEHAEEGFSLREAKMPTRQLPQGLETENIASFEPPTTAQMQLAVHSRSSPASVSSKVDMPAILPHVLQPLKRRSAQTRRSSSSSIEAATSRPAAKRSKSGQGTWLPSSSSDDLQVVMNGAEIGPKWHRERMRRLQSGGILNDEPKTNGEVHDG